MNLFIENKYLTGINIVSIIELNLHNIIAKLLFKVDDFADFIYLERYINYIKQGVIYFYEYLFPKIKLQNFKSYLYTMRYVYLLYIVFFAFIYLYFTYYNIKLFYGIKVLGYFYIFLIYPLFILIFNFIKSIIFCKYASDRNNFTVTIVAIVIKMSIIITLSKSFGIIIIPIALIFTEIFIGLTRARLLSIQIRSQL